MRRKRPQYIDRIFQFAVTVVVLAGCTRVFPIPDSAVNYPERNQIDLSVELRLTKQFCEYAWKLGWNWRLPLGEALEKQAKILTTTLFWDVIIRRGDTEAIRRNVDVVLTPRILSVDMKPDFWNAQDVAIYVQWVLSRPDGQILWSKTIEGMALDENRAMFRNAKKTRERLIQKAFDDLFLNSFEAIWTSPQIRMLSNSR